MTLIVHLFLMEIVSLILLKKIINVFMQNDEITFVVGSVALKDMYPTNEEMVDAMRAIEKLMLEYGIIKIDVCINPYALPEYVKNL